jgi:hypothetical protein
MRHVKNLHDGKAILVRPYEYIAGRVSGKFPEGDPLQYRHRKSTGNSNIPFTRINSMTNDRPIQTHRAPRIAVHETNQRPVKDYLFRIESPTNRSNYNDQSHNQMGQEQSSSTMQRLLERKLKLQKFEILAKKHFLPHIAKQMIVGANIQANILEDDQAFETNLEILFNLDRTGST